MQAGAGRVRVDRATCTLIPTTWTRRVSQLTRDVRALLHLRIKDRRQDLFGHEIKDFEVVGYNPTRNSRRRWRCSGARRAPSLPFGSGGSQACQGYLPGPTFGTKLDNETEGIARLAGSPGSASRRFGLLGHRRRPGLGYRGVGHSIPGATKAVRVGRRLVRIIVLERSCQPKRCDDGNGRRKG